MGLEKFDLLNNSSNTFIDIKLDIKFSSGGNIYREREPRVSEFCVQQTVVYILTGH